MKFDMKGIAIILAGIGALNWGLVEFLKFNVVSLLGSGIIPTIIYGLVGISGVYVLFDAFKK